MKIVPNMGMLDKVLRFLSAIVIIGLYFMNIISGITASILLVVSGVFIITGFLSFCPLYVPFKINTKKNK